MGRVLLLIHSRNWTNNSKKEGFGGAQHTQKVIPRTNLPLFGLQHAPTSPLSNPPRSAPILALCPPLWRCTVCQDNNHSKQGRQRPNGGGQKFVFSLEPTVFGIFLLTPDFWQYNIVLFFHLRSFLRKLNLTTFVFNTPSFLLFFWFVFGSFFGFFRTASFIFSSLCIFVSISQISLVIWCLVQYRTALNKGK